MSRSLTSWWSTVRVAFTYIQTHRVSLFPILPVREQNQNMLCFIHATLIYIVTRQSTCRTPCPGRCVLKNGVEYSLFASAEIYFSLRLHNTVVPLLVQDHFFWVVMVSLFDTKLCTLLCFLSSHSWAGGGGRGPCMLQTDLQYAAVSVLQADSHDSVSSLTQTYKSDAQVSWF